MADGAVVHIGENSPEFVALTLMRHIADAEKRETYGHGDHPITREWILKTYEQCLSVVRGADAKRVLEDYQPESFAGKHRG